MDTYDSLFAKPTAPIIATSSKTEAISNGSTKSVKRLFASVSGLPNNSVAATGSSGASPLVITATKAPASSRLAPMPKPPPKRRPRPSAAGLKTRKNNTKKNQKGPPPNQDLQQAPQKARKGRKKSPQTLAPP